MVVFYKIIKDDLEEIVYIQLGRVNQLLEKSDFILDVQDSAKKYPADIGYDQDYGARLLKRAIQRELQDKLASKVLAGEYKPDSIIFVRKGKAGLEFTD